MYLMLYLGDTKRGYKPAIRGLISCLLSKTNSAYDISEFCIGTKYCFQYNVLSVS